MSVGKHPDDARTLVTAKQMGAKFSVPIPTDMSGIAFVRFYIRPHDPSLADNPWSEEAAVVPDNGATTLVHKVEFPEDGFYEVAAKAEDGAGNVSPTYLAASEVVLVDSVPPILTTISYVSP